MQVNGNHFFSGDMPGGFDAPLGKAHCLCLYVTDPRFVCTSGGSRGSR